MPRLAIALVAAVLSSGPAHAVRWQISVETSPSTFTAEEIFNDGRNPNIEALSPADQDAAVSDVIARCDVLRAADPISRSREAQYLPP